MTFHTLAFLVIPLTLYFLFRNKPKIYLQSPPSPSIFTGHSQTLRYAPDNGVSLLESWYEEYGPVFEVPLAAGMKQITICDPKAISYLFSRDGVGFVRSKGFKKVVESVVGRGLIWADGEAHRRQRRAVAPAFSNASLREMTPLVFDTVYKLKNGWTEIIDSMPSREAVVDAQEWINHFTLDTIGSAGFGYDFGAMQGRRSAVLDTLDIFNAKPPEGLAKIIHMVNFILPILTGLPIGRKRLFMKLSATMKTILSQIFNESRKRNTVSGEQTKKERKYGGKSALSVLVNAANAKSDLGMSEEEIMAQMKSLLIAGYDAPAAALTWAVIELCRHPEIQDQLREELMTFKEGDPTWDQLSSDFPHLDAFTCEVLRMHPSLSEIGRMAGQDEWIPLSTPMKNSLGQEMDHVFVPKGSHVSVPVAFMNRSEKFWGADAKVFNPKRWLNGGDFDGQRAKEIQGFKHILSFGEGPRICIGRGLALIMLKASLFVLLRNFSLELRDGRFTKIESHWSLLPRPKVAGEEGCRVPIKVRHLQ
ncbi:hypothetical protein AX16_005188 [Volvariella volvacea WC 439]|nr:hypothetical protein AX16_005188 [Volvariella volvacea WC 439]